MFDLEYDNERLLQLISSSASLYETELTSMSVDAICEDIELEADLADMFVSRRDLALDQLTKRYLVLVQESEALKQMMLSITRSSRFSTAEKGKRMSDLYAQFTAVNNDLHKIILSLDYMVDEPEEGEKPEDESEAESEQEAEFRRLSKEGLGMAPYRFAVGDVVTLRDHDVWNHIVKALTQQPELWEKKTFTVCKVIDIEQPIIPNRKAVSPDRWNQQRLTLVGMDGEYHNSWFEPKRS